MTQTLSQTLRELAGKATLALIDALEAVDRGESQSRIDELRVAVATTHDGLAHAFMQHQDTILAALELQERLDAPETVEAVARASRENDELCYARGIYRNSNIGLYFEKAAQAAITSLKGSGII